MVRVLGNLFVALTLAGATLSSAVPPVKRDFTKVTVDLSTTETACKTLKAAADAVDKTKPVSDSLVSTLSNLVQSINSAFQQTTTDAKTAGSFTVDQANQVVNTVQTGIVGVLTPIVVDLSSEVVAFSTPKAKQAVCSSLSSISLNLITMVGALANDCPASQKATLEGFVSANATLIVDTNAAAKTYGCH